MNEKLNEGEIGWGKQRKIEETERGRESVRNKQPEEWRGGMYSLQWFLRRQFLYLGYSSDDVITSCTNQKPVGLQLRLQVLCARKNTLGPCPPP